MERKLKSALKNPKLRSGAKAFALALALYFLPLWVAGVLTLVFYFWSPAFSSGFLGSLIALFAVAETFFSAFPSFFAAAVFGAAFFILLGVKNILFFRRPLYFYLFLGFVSSLAVWLFFNGLLSLLVLAFVIFFLVKDALNAFAPFPGRVPLLSVVSAFAVAEIAWAVFYLGIQPFWAAVSVILVFVGILFVIVKYLRGHIFKSNAPFWTVTLAVIAFAIIIIAAF